MGELLEAVRAVLCHHGVHNLDIDRPALDELLEGAPFRGIPLVCQRCGVRRVLLPGHARTRPR